MRGSGRIPGVGEYGHGLTTSYYAGPRMLRPAPSDSPPSRESCGALLRYLSSFEGFQLSKGLGLGNKVDVNESDALSYLMDDEQTQIIGMYLEDVRDGRKFLETAKRARRKSRSPD